MKKSICGRTAGILKIFLWSKKNFRKRICIFFFLIAQISVTFTRGGMFECTFYPDGLQSNDLYRMKSVRDVQISPNNQQIAYTIEYRNRPGQPYSQVWIMDLKTGRSSRLGSDVGTGSSPFWSPDGQRIAYLGREGDEYGLYVSDDEGTGIKFLAPVQGTNHPLPSSGNRLAWSPDGKMIAFLSATPGPETEEASGDPIVITRYLYKPTASEGLTRFNDNRRLHIFVFDLTTKKVRQLTHGIYYEHSIDWSPNGKEILFVSNHEPDPDRFFNYDLLTVNVEDDTIRRLTSTENAEYRPRWSPDGNMIAYQGTKRGLTSSETTMEDTHIWLVNADGSGRFELGSMIDNRQGPPSWRHDGKAVYFTVQERGNVHLYCLPISGSRPEKIVEERRTVSSFSVSQDGRIAYVFNSPYDMPQLFLKEKQGRKMLTHLNADLLSNKQITEVESFTFLSFDGMEVEAFLTKPHGLKAGSKHPLIVMIKGGPHGQRGPALNLKAQVYASQGYAVLMVNYRGSTGYGQRFADAIFGDQNGGEAQDVLYRTLAALRRYTWLDPDRVGVEGGSYGGQLTNWLITQTSLFKAAIPSASISNLISFNYMSYYHDYLAVEFGMFPHQGNLMDFLWERSALKHAAKVKTPTMFIHGENDNDVPIAEAEQFYIALKDVGVETIMVRYPREGHGIRETRHNVDLIDRSIEWYEKHFGASKHKP